MTGLGAVTSLGNTVEATWAGLVAGRSGAGPITQFDSSGYAVHFACEVRDLELTDYMDYKASRRMDRFTHLALAAARQAETDSGLTIAPIAERVGASRDMVSRIFRDLTVGGYISVENRFITINKKPPARW